MVVVEELNGADGRRAEPVDGVDLVALLRQDHGEQRGDGPAKAMATQDDRLVPLGQFFPQRVKKVSYGPPETRVYRGECRLVVGVVNDRAGV